MRYASSPMPRRIVSASRTVQDAAKRSPVCCRQSSSPGYRQRSAARRRVGCIAG
jgi:hypothetical protein